MLNANFASLKFSKKCLHNVQKPTFGTFDDFNIWRKSLKILQDINFSLTNPILTTTILHFAFKTSLATFKFMKVELKYWRFMNSNDPIFKTDLAS